MTIKDKIIELFEQQSDWGVKEIADRLLVSKQAVHYALRQLLEEDVVEKFGRTPKTIYRLKQKKDEKTQQFSDVSAGQKAFLEEHFIQISEIGEILKGLEAFSHWCAQRNLPVKKTLKEFLETKKKYRLYYSNGLIDGTPKLLNTKGFEKIFLDKLYYLDFYAIERFGKTPLGTLLHFAKQGQNKMLMKLIVDKVNDKIHEHIKKVNINAIAFVPPTIRREVQIMRFLETQLNINLPVVKIQKISGIIPVPQKSLHKMHERIRNAENTFAIKETVKYKHVLLIDDAVGSGATMNQIAGKLKNKNIAQKVSGLAIVGSFKGFDVITDV